MRRRGWRKGVAIGLVAVLVGGGAFVQSQGGWNEMFKVPAKLDGSTPADQNGFEFLGTARSTEEERAPRLVQGDLSLGGVAGLIGATRIWFRLPEAKVGESRIPKEDSLAASVRFPDGVTYPVRWEMADLSQRIATLMIPSGHPPADFIDVEVGNSSAKAKWRLTSLPETPLTLASEGSATFEAEGARVTAKAHRLPGESLVLEPMGGVTAGALLEVALDVPTYGPVGKGIRVRFERYAPEYRHPADLASPNLDAQLVSGEMDENAIPLAFPYSDLQRRVGIYGHLEVIETTHTPAEFKNARWAWYPVPGKDPAVLVASDGVKLADGSTVTVHGSIEGGRLKFVSNSSSASSLDKKVLQPDIGVIDIQCSEEGIRTQKLAVERSKSQPKGKNIPIGSVRGTVVVRRVVKSIPFRLLVPVGPLKSGDRTQPAPQMPSKTVNGRL